jgi:hypothetical protein
MYVAKLADFHSTEIALNHGIEYTKEANFFQRNQSARIAGLVLTPLVLYETQRRLGVDKKWRIISAVVVSTVWSIFAVHNYRVNNYVKEKKRIELNFSVSF